MSPFDVFLNESRKVKSKYAIWIEKHPERKDELLQEMNKIISDLLNTCENTEKQSFITRDKLKEFGIQQQRKYITYKKIDK